MAGPSPADDGLAQAVRRVRLAAGSLAGPLDVWTIAVAAAQAVPDVLDPALERLTPSPFAGLAGRARGGPRGRRGEASTGGGSPGSTGYTGSIGGAGGGADRAGGPRERSPRRA